MIVPEPSRPEPLDAHVTAAPVAQRPSSSPEPAPIVVTVRTPPVTVGRFAALAASSAILQPSRNVRSAAFDTEIAKAPELRIAAATAGGFDAPTSGTDARTGVDRAAHGVAVGGFGHAVPGAAASSSPTGGGVADAGFGSAPGGSRSESAAPAPAPAQVGAAGFNTPAAGPTAKSHGPLVAPRLDTPVEVVSKPTPDYTDEARALKLEGNVLLEVEFTANGHVKVLRVVRGLGYGLDEAAIRAAEGIRFKPAQSGGRLIDVQTTIHILFRLT